MCLPEPLGALPGAAPEQDRLEQAWLALIPGPCSLSWFLLLLQGTHLTLHPQSLWNAPPPPLGLHSSPWVISFSFQLEEESHSGHRAVLCRGSVWPQNNEGRGQTRVPTPAASVCSRQQGLRRVWFAQLVPGTENPGRLRSASAGEGAPRSYVSTETGLYLERLESLGLWERPGTFLSFGSQSPALRSWPSPGPLHVVAPQLLPLPPPTPPRLGELGQRRPSLEPVLGGWGQQDFSVKKETP